MNRKSRGDRPARPIGPVAAILCGLPLMACSLITVHTPAGDTRTMSQHEFAEYVEQVFRYHNQVVNELIELSATDDKGESAELAKEEARMLQACASLNEVVSESMAGLDSNFRAKMQLVDAVPECEEATRKVEDLLP